MKRLIALVFFSLTFQALANVEVYKNNSGCTVEKEMRANGTVLYISANNKQEIVGYGKDFSFGSFAYCDDSVLDINFFEGKAGTGILLSCSEHQNGHAVTRGRVDISIMGNQLKSVAIDGQVKSTFGWKQDTKIDCRNLIKQ